jgi:hypothetical protein
LIEEWGTVLAVIGMLAATLVAAALANRYQAHQARVRDTVRRLDAGVSALNDSLSALGRVPLSRELRLVVRGEVVARCRRIRALARRTPGIDQRISAAEAALQAEGGTPPGGVGPIENEQAFRRLTTALDELLAVLQQGRLVQPVPLDVRGIFVRELGERRAEVLARFHLVESHRREEDGDLLRARAHITTLMHGLRQRGPSTDFVRELYREAETALSGLSQRHVGPPAEATA